MKHFFVGTYFGLRIKCGDNIMSKSNSINLKDMKRINKSVLLKCLWKHEELSRTELAEKTGLSPSTITSLSEELINEKIVIEERAGESTGGRKPVMLKINPSSGFICAVNILPRSITYTLISMDLKKIKEFVVKNPEEVIIQGLFENLVRDINLLLNENELGKDRLIGIGISIPKEYDEIDKRVMFNTGVSADRMNLDEALNFYYKRPIFIENEINAKAIAEYYFGTEKYKDGLIYLDVSEHIRAAIVYEGQVIRNPILQNNEVGHMIIDRNGPRCSCGRKGCLDALASVTAIMRKVVSGLNESKTKSLIKAMEGNVIKVDANMIIKYANEGDSIIKDIINEVVEALCIGIINFSAILNIRNVVVGGKIMKIRCFADTLKKVSDELELTQNDGIIVMPAILSDDSINMGNGAIVLSNYFKSM